MSNCLVENTMTAFSDKRHHLWIFVDIFDQLMVGATCTLAACYRYDVESLISKLRPDGQKFMVLRKSYDMTSCSVSARVAKSQETFESVFLTLETNWRSEKKSFSCGSRIRQPKVALHVSQTTRDMWYAVTLYKQVLRLDPFQQATFDDGRYAIFGSQGELWRRDDAKLGTHSPAWIEECVENATMENYTSVDGSM